MRRPSLSVSHVRRGFPAWAHRPGGPSDRLAFGGDFARADDGRDDGPPRPSSRFPLLLRGSSR
eukprot:633053-Pyramimonas_sp.AAC.1